MTALTERAVLAGGCFWGMQDLLRRCPGVIATRVGYTGGDVPNATYRNVRMTCALEFESPHHREERPCKPSPSEAAPPESVDSP